MTQQTINIGNQPGDGTGDPARTAFTKVNQNFTEVYTNSTPAGTSGQIQYKSGTALGGFTASGDATINTTTGLSVSSIVVTGSSGALGGQGAGGGPAQSASYRGGGGGGGGTCQSDQGGQQNGTQSPGSGAGGAVFIWWGY